MCVRRLHDMGGGGGAVEDEAAGQGGALGCFVHRIPSFAAAVLAVSCETRRARGSGTRVWLGETQRFVRQFEIQTSR